MHVYKTKWFARFAKREQLSNNSLREAVERAERGLIDADLGGGLIKQRVARPGKGKSGGYRTLVAYRSKQRAIFLYGFAKNEREYVRPDELTSFRRAGEYWLSVDAVTIGKSLEDGAIEEVGDGQES